MNLKPRAIIPLLLLAGFIFFQVYLIFWYRFQVQDYHRYGNDFPQPLSRGDYQVMSVGQMFRTPGPLVRIDIMLANYKVKPTGGVLQLGIFDHDRCLFLGKYPANTVEDNQFYRFAINPDSVPAGVYTMELKHFPDHKNERLAVWIYRQDIYPHGNLLVGGKPAVGDMTFRVYYLSTLWRQWHRFRNTWLGLGLVLMLAALNVLVYFFITPLWGALARDKKIRRDL